MLNKAVKLFIKATEAVPPEYMAIPMAEQDAYPLERVYTYELYHQLRIRTSDSQYRWGGEVDKAVNHHFAASGLPGYKPDLLFHRPGVMDGNILVVEVKMCRGILRSDWLNDLKKITALRRNGAYFRAYQRGIFLLVGGDLGCIEHVRTVARQRMDDQVVDLALVDLFWHATAGQGAKIVPW